MVFEIKILFAPTHLAEAKHAGVLRRLFEEFEGTEPEAELRVVRVLQDQPLKLILRRPGLPEVITTVSKGWLHEDTGEWEIRERLLELLAPTTTTKPA